MTSPARTHQRAASEAAILDAAVELYAVYGPDGTSLREVAHSAGLTHALVARYFGSKQGLVAAVEEQLVAVVRTAMASLEPVRAESIVELLASARERPAWVRLLVRSGLGDLDGAQVAAVIGERCSDESDGSDRDRRCRYAAASLLLGWLSWDGFLVPALGLGPMSRRRQDEAMAGAAAALLHLAARSEPALAARPLISSSTVVADAAPPSRSAREALLASAVELFATLGPASVSVRDIARHAGVNHGLIHRHFGSRDELLAEAIEVGSTSLLTGATAPGGFDIDAVVHAMRHVSPSARTIARVLVDDIPIGSVRRRYPVLRNLLDLARRLPPGDRPPALVDPRCAAAAAASLVVGSVIWGAHLHEVFGLRDDVGSTMADLGRHLLGAPASTPDSAPDPDEDGS